MFQAVIPKPAHRLLALTLLRGVPAPGGSPQTRFLAQRRLETFAAAGREDGGTVLACFFGKHPAEETNLPELLRVAAAPDTSGEMQPQAHPHVPRQRVIHALRKQARDLTAGRDNARDEAQPCGVYPGDQRTRLAGGWAGVRSNQ